VAARDSPALDRRVRRLFSRRRSSPLAVMTRPPSARASRRSAWRSSPP
jgi:hypothetical protein